MKILITGASGFLGRHFDAEVIRQDEGHEVWACDIVPNNFLATDVEDMESWLASFDQHVDLVIHLAAPVGGREKIDGDPMYNADSLRLDSVLFRWALTHARTVIYPSSSAVYPVAFQQPGVGGIKLDELMFHPSNGKWMAPDQMYGFTKLAGEYVGWKAAQQGLDVLAIRPFSGYGPGQSFDYPVPSIARRALAKEDPLVVWGSGDQRRDFVHVRDVVGATFARLAQGVDGFQTMNIGSGWSWSFKDVAMIAAEIVGYRPEIINDASKPEGVFTRVADASQMRKVYRQDLVTFRDGMVEVLKDVEQRVAAEAAMLVH